MAITYAYAADISKFEKTESGDLLVEGIATDPSKDLDGQRCDPEWLKSAMPEWFEWGNIRDQHSARSAGVAQKMDQLPGDAWWVQTLVTDPIAQHKVETKTYKGYSIGIRDAVLKAIGGEEWICGGKIVEVSLVDRPCNPTAKLALAKSITPGASVTVKPGTEIDPTRMLIKCAEVLDLPENASLPGDHWVTKAADQQAEKEPPGLMHGEDARHDGPPAGDKLAALHSYVAQLNKVAEGLPASDADAAKAAAPTPALASVTDLERRLTAFSATADTTLRPAEVMAHVNTVVTRLGRTDLVPASWKTTWATLEKGHDGDQLAAIRDGLVQCISAELAELCQGERELCDVDELLTSLRYFLCWWSGEAIEGEVDSPYDDSDSIDITWLAAKEATVPNQNGPADTTTKAASDTSTTTTQPATDAPGAQPQRETVAKEALSDLIKNAVTEATKGLQGRLDAAETALAKVAGASQAGGPALMASNPTDTKATTKAADHYAQLAENTVDPNLRYFYKQKAVALREAGKVA